MEIFNALWSKAKTCGAGAHCNAVCVSTLDAQGYPSSRFVDLKEASEDGFVFCTHLESSKALDIGRNPKAGITLWWPHVATQIRIKGICTPIAEQEADAHWAGRVPDAQLATATFQQRRPLADLALLKTRYAEAVAASDGKPLLRPANWGGFRLLAESIEMMEFKESRLHARTLYSRTNAGWDQALLQP